jgi:predicted nucleic acid-binding protein
MIVLDTNVVSETMKPEPNATVRAWFDAQAIETLCLTSITLAELRFGVLAMPEGKRKDRLTAFLEELTSLYEDRVLPFDLAAARHHAELALAAKVRGRGFPLPNGYIAAIAASRGYAIASRDSAPFEAAGLQVINPWHP